MEFTKFLGIYLDKDLNWEHHMSQLYNKINSSRHLLGFPKIILDERNLIKIYYAHIYSHLQYGINAWGSMVRKSQLNSIYTLQKVCVKTINKNLKSASTMELFKKYKLLKLHDIVNLELGMDGIWYKV